ncbi:MAG: hypothetical protein CVU63_17550 [Deltaproteobacteria bacterium HGW-Deltaproteobacteria-20]|nr:MAG: hypothetical protein CVU63_17550 [Deltaproteobacteria bacterium HGW-Deltaproteobacteria-20]
MEGDAPPCRTAAASASRASRVELERSKGDESNLRVLPFECRYPRTVGDFDPSTAEWVVSIQSGWLE